MENKLFGTAIAVIIASLLGYAAVVGFVIWVIVKLLQHFGII